MFGLSVGTKAEMPSAETALKGRSEAIKIAATHLHSGNPMQGPWPADSEIAVFGMGCFWGIERLFWMQTGVYSTAVGYIGGYTENPYYEEVCTGATGHNEVVQVVFLPAEISYSDLLTLFWENHDPTQGMRQGNDRGTQYRSGVYTTSVQQQELATQSLAQYQTLLAAKGYSEVTTEIIEAPRFYYAEDYHQQYLIKNPGGYCNMQGTGVACSIS